MKRILSILLIATLLFAATACGNSGDTSQAAGEASGSSEPAQPSQAGGEASPQAEPPADISAITSIDPSDPNKPEKLVLLSAPDAGIIFPYIEAWEQATGIKVERSEVAMDSLHTQLSTLFAAKSAEVDILWTYVAWTSEFASAGHILDISDKLTQAEWDEYSQGSLNCISYQGARYGIPKFYSIRSFYCNMDLLKAAGYENPPANWDELVEIANAVTDPAKEQYGLLLGFGSNENLSITYQDILSLYNLTLCDKDDNVLFSSEKGTEAFKRIADLQASGVVDPASFGVTSGNERRARFLTGNVAMTWEWAALDKEARDQGTFEIVSSLTPAIEQTAALTGSEGHAISAYSQNQEYALDLLRYLASDDVQKQMSLNTGWYPVKNSVFNDPEVVAASQIMETAAAQSQHPTFRFAAPYYTEMVDRMTVSLFEALNGSKDAAQAVADAAAAAETVIASYK